MLLSSIAANWVLLREPQGLYVSADTVQRCFVMAVQFYQGYADLDDTTATEMDTVTAGTNVTASEWAVCKPLAMLYVEREEAKAFEASRGLGTDMVGRTVSEVEADIRVTEDAMQQEAYFQLPWLVGVP